MTEVTLAELNRIASMVCDNICRWPDKLKTQEELDEKCAACKPICDMVHLLEKLEAMAPPDEGDPVYCIVNGCDNCPFPDAIEAFQHCRDCRKLIVCDEPFNPSEHLKGWYDKEVFKYREDAEEKLRNMTEK